MPRKVEAIFVCSHVEDGRVEMHATYDDESWEEFTKATPGGSLDMIVDEDCSAYEVFEAGETYRLTFEKVDSDDA